MAQKLQTLANVQALLQDVQYKDWRFHVAELQGNVGALPTRGFLVQVQFTDEHDTPLTGRKWLLSLFATDSEVIQTAFLAVLTAVEHEVREAFQFRGHAILGPHIDVTARLPLDARVTA